MDRSPLAEPVPIADIFCSGVGAIEAVGSEMLRFYLYVLQPIAPGMPQERVVVAKIVMQRTAVTPGVLECLHMAGVPMLQGGEAELARH